MAVDQSMRILVAYEYPMMLRIIRNYLNQFGFHNIEQARDER